MTLQNWDQTSYQLETLAFNGFGKEARVVMLEILVTPSDERPPRIGQSPCTNLGQSSGLVQTLALSLAAMAILFMEVEIDWPFLGMCSWKKNS